MANPFAAFAPKKKNPFSVFVPDTTPIEGYENVPGAEHFITPDDEVPLTSYSEKEQDFAQRGIVQDKPIDEGHFESGLTLPGKEEEAFRKANEGIEFHIDEDSGELLWLDPESNRWTTIGSDMESWIAPGAVLAGEIGGGVAGALAGSVAGAPVAGAIAAESGMTFIGEMIRLLYGQSRFGLSEGVSPHELAEHAAKQAGITGLTGAAGAKLLQAGKFIANHMKGRYLPENFNNLKALPENQQAMDRVNDVTGEKFKPTLGEQSEDLGLLTSQARLEQSQEFGTELTTALRQREKENVESLGEFYDKTAPVQKADNLGPSDVGRDVLNVTTPRARQVRDRWDTRVENVESQLENYGFPPASDVGGAVRNSLEKGQESLKYWAKDATAEFDELGRGLVEIDNNILAGIAGDIKDKPFMMDSLRRNTDSLLGPKTKPAPDGLLDQFGEPIDEVPTDLFDPNKKWTFEEAWNTASELKRRSRQINVTGTDVDRGTYKRLIGAIEQQMDNAIKGTPLGDKFAAFKLQYRKANDLLNRRVAGEIMKRSDNGYALYNSDVFKRISSGAPEAAEDLAKAIKYTPEGSATAMQAVRDAWERKYKDFMGDDPTPKRHKAFVKKHHEQMKPFFNKREFEKIKRFGGLTKVLERTRKSRDIVLNRMKQGLIGDLTRLDEKRIYKSIWGKDNIREITRTREIMKNTPEVWESVQRQVLQDMRDKAFPAGGEKFSYKGFQKYYGEHKRALRAMFGDEYLKDLDVMERSLRMITGKFKDWNHSGTGAFLKDESIAPVGLGKVTSFGKMWLFGPLSHKGAVLRKGIDVKTDMSNRALANAIMNPGQLKAMIKLSQLKPGSAAAAAILAGPFGPDLEHSQ